MKKPSAAAAPQDFLLEIGCEELPADYLPHALRSLQFSAWCQLDPGQGYRWRQIETWASPRRLVLIVRGLEAVVRWEKIGPSRAAAYDAQGHPTPAAQGFAKSQGVAVTALQVKETPKGSCVVAQRAEPVVSTLTTALPVIIKGIQFPKRMRWGDGRTAFARPIRWLVALYGRHNVPCEIAGLSSGRRSAALRRARTPWLSLTSAAEYLRTMPRAGIVLERSVKPTDCAPLPSPGEWTSLPADPTPPKVEVLRRQLTAAARAAGGQLDAGEECEELLAHVTFLAEQPVVAAGAFRLEYLTLPPEVLATAMAKHLKAFSVRDAQGRLLPKFLVVLEGKPTSPRVVTANHERILEARFTDAQFFWREDIKLPLADRAAQLAGVVFHKSLGTLAEKAARLGTVTRHVRGAGPALHRAIALAKADLVTQMVREFPTLQGVMGSAYAAHDGEPAEVAQALREQYAPRTAGDPLPASETGTWLSVLDRLDTLTGFFGVGLAPTSSEDPYGLRRQALGLVRILVEKPLSLDLDTFLDAALESWGARLTKPAADVRRQLRAFLDDRFRWWACEQHDYPRELVEAVLAGRRGDLADVAQRLRILHDLWCDERRRAAVLFPAGKVMERTGRIVASAKQSAADQGAPDPAKFTAPEERALWDRWATVKAATAQHLQAREYAKASETYGTLYPALHQFFEHVFIMDENPDVRRNRLAMMREIYDLYANRVGDLSKLPLPNDL